jgi:hypothetical protein
MKNMTKKFGALCVACSLTALTALTALTGCDDKKNYGEAIPVVTYNDVAGSWKLVSLDGNEINPNVYAYLRMESRAIEDDPVGWRAYQTYSTLGSAQPVEKTGTYILKKDTRDRATIEGLYDNFGYWQQDYYLIAVNGDIMTWTGGNDDTHVAIYQRVDASVIDAIISQIRD